MKTIVQIIFLFFFVKFAYSQNLVQKFEGINFSLNGNLSQVPFNGGVNNARYQFVDIDSDNDFDLFMYDTDTSLYYYRNVGTSQSSSFKLISTKFQNLSFKNWFYFVDIDSDNDFDLFTGGEIQTIKYYRNDGNSSSPEFNIAIEELHSNADSIIYSESNCVPIFCDIDADGDRDFFTGQSLGTITYYENIGTLTNFNLKFITDFWEELLIISPALRIHPKTEKNISLHLSRDFSNPHYLDGNRHGANSLEFVDIDGDNDFDLFWGDLFSAGIYFIRNEGTPTKPDVAIIDSTYPSNSPYFSHGFNSTRFVDIDADGDKDLFISVLYLSQNNKNLAFYKNNGTSTNANFQRMSEDFLNSVDVGGNSNITFTDIDNDNDRDLFIGNDIPAKLSYYKNTGTNLNPSFTLMTDSLPIFSTGLNYNYAPAFADLDNDGDKDLLLGSYIKDSLWFYRNIGTPTSFNFLFEARGSQIGLTSLGQSSTPTFIDIDNDNDKDLFIGASDGKIYYYENTGTISNFNFTFRTNNYNSIDVGDDSAPKFFDIDNDNDFDLFIGRQVGRISFYKNEGSASLPNFVFQSNDYKNINVHQSSCPEFADIDGDTDLDLFIGNVKGGLFYYENRDLVGIENETYGIPDKFDLLQNYPNPFNPVTNIKYKITKYTHVSLKVYDVLGNEIAILVNEKQNAGNYVVTFDGINFPSGIYFYKIEANGYVESKKMLYIK